MCVGGMCVCSACVVHSNYVHNEFVRIIYIMNKMHGSHHTIYSILVFYGTAA